MTLRKIDGYVLDCIVSEEVTLDAEVTGYPVERGGTIVDHVRNLPLSIDLELVVSDTPIGEVAAQRRADVVPSSEARVFLRRLRSERRPFTFEGTTGSYDLMIFEHLGEPRDNETGDALIIEATLRQIELIEVRREVVRTVNLGHRTSRKVNGPKMWLCPDLLAFSNDDAANRAKKCREIVLKDGVPHFVDNGQRLTIGEVARFERQRYTGKESGDIVLQEGQLVLDPERGWVNRTSFGDGRAVDTPLTARQRAHIAEFEGIEGYKQTGVDGYSLDSRDGTIITGRSVPDLGL